MSSNEKVIVITILMLSVVIILVVVVSFQSRAVLTKKEVLLNDITESNPFVWKGSLDYLVTEKPPPIHSVTDLAIYHFPKQKLVSFSGPDLDFASAMVYEDRLYVFATKDPAGVNKSVLYLITSSDLQHFSNPIPLFHASKIQGFFNTSVVYNQDQHKFVMALEVYEEGYMSFTFLFFESLDAIHWTPTGQRFGNKYYVAAPNLKYINGYYYLWFLRDLAPKHNPQCKNCHQYVTDIARSKDFQHWDIATKHFLEPEVGEGINTSDVRLTDYQGKAYVFYGIGDQATWAKLKYATANVSMSKLVSSYFEK